MPISFVNDDATAIDALHKRQDHSRPTRTRDFPNPTYKRFLLCEVLLCQRNTSKGRCSGNSLGRMMMGLTRERVDTVLGVGAAGLT